jgi:hypothetical protein
VNGLEKFQTNLVPISAKISAIPVEVIHGSLLSLQTNEWIVLVVGHDHFLGNYLQIRR